MARRKELKNIAAGLYGSFISRNNDVNGYWGMGKLSLLAQQHTTNQVSINLLNKSILPHDKEFAHLISNYHTLLFKLISTKAISKEWLRSATIDLNFSPKNLAKKHILISTWGTLFSLSVTIIDDKNKIHKIFGYGYCAPHNPQKEHKRFQTSKSPV
jgi:hypothetical protein